VVSAQSKARIYHDLAKVPDLLHNLKVNLAREPFRFPR